VPDAGASEVLTAAAATLGLEAATLAALERIAADFDAARILAPAWEANDAIDEFEAELSGCTQRAVAFPAFAAPSVTPEPQVPVTARRATFSASSLNAFAECERKWFYRYVCGAVEDRGSSASFYGIAFHAALEEFHGTYARFDGGDPPTLGSFLDYCIVASFDRHRTRFDAPVEFELQKRRARRTAKRYLTWLLERARKAPFEVIGCETTTDVQLGGFACIGFIDRIDRDDATGSVTVVDYKTGAIAKSAGEYLAGVLAFTEFQLPFYYWARTAAGDNVTRLSLVPLKDALLDVEPIELTVVAHRAPPNGRTKNATTASIGVPDLERARERMIEIAGTLATPTIAHYAVTNDPDACRYCAYKDACRERPLVAEERFGR
jgi:RecB family exonuclease